MPVFPPIPSLRSTQELQSIAFLQAMTDATLAWSKHHDSSIMGILSGQQWLKTGVYTPDQFWQVWTPVYTKVFQAMYALFTKKPEAYTDLLHHTDTDRAAIFSYYISERLADLEKTSFSIDW